MKEVLNIEQFVELHRWVIENAPKTLQYAAKFLDEFAVLYKPLKMDTFADSHMQGNLNVSTNSAQKEQTLNQGNKSFN